MGLASPEPAVDLAALLVQSCRTLAGRFGPVMSPAERSEVGLSMVITGPDVIHVGRGARATLTVFTVGAAKAVAPQDAHTELLPVSRETLESIRTGPLGHPRITALDVVTRGLGHVGAERRNALWTRGSLIADRRYCYLLDARALGALSDGPEGA